MINALKLTLRQQSIPRLLLFVSMDIRPVVISGPSGAGKSTLIKKLFQEYPDSFGFSVSHTTRQMRNGEENHKQYHFVSVEEMKREIDQGKFLEYTNFSGNYYGTSIAAVDEVTSTNRICILDIDEQGVKNIKGSSLNAIYVFIQPPSLEELRRRLVARKTDTDAAIDKRMATAKSAVQYSQEDGVYDLIVVNNELEKAYEHLRQFLKEKCPVLRSPKKQNPGLELPLAANVKHLQSMARMDAGDSIKENGFTEIQLDSNSVAEIPLSPSKASPEHSKPAEIIVTETPLLVMTSDTHNQDLDAHRSSPAVVHLEADPDATTTADGVCGRQSWCSIS